MKNTSKKTDNMRFRVLSFLIRFLPVCLFFIVLFYVISPFYVRLFLPLFKKQLEFMHPEYKVLKYEIIKIRGIDYLRYTIRVNKPMAHRVDNADNQNVVRLKGQASTLCVAPVIILSLLFSWPALTFRHRFYGVILSIPLIILITAADYPLIFISNIESVYSASALGNILRQIWNHILNNGGRQFLALIAFLICIAPAYLKLDMPSVKKIKPTGGKTGRNDPCPCGSGKKHKNCCLKKG